MEQTATMSAAAASTAVQAKRKIGIIIEVYEEDVDSIMSSIHGDEGITLFETEIVSMRLLGKDAEMRCPDFDWEIHMDELELRRWQR